MAYDPQKHHRRSIRLKGYDYSQPGLYFVTICTHHREHIFGEIINGKIHLNDWGEIAQNEWVKTGDMRPNITILEFVIMPNHVYGTIKINETAGCRGTMHRPPTAEHHVPVFKQFGKPTSNTIPTIIRGYKSSVTNQINQLRYMSGCPVWQRNYYEHIIRDEHDLNRIRVYILSNPQQRPADKFYTIDKFQIPI